MAQVELTRKQIDMILDGLYHVHNEFAHILIDAADEYHHNEQGKLIKIMEGLSQQIRTET